MGIHGYLAILAKRWTLVVSVLLVALAASVGSILVTTPTYRAEAQLFVSTQISAGNLNQELFQGSNFSADRVKSYTQLATSPKVLDPVIEELGLQTTAADLARTIEAQVPLETVLISVVTTSESPELSAAIANATATSLATVIEDLETSDTRGTSPVKAQVVRAAPVPESPSWPSVPVNLAVGLILGAVVAVGLAVLLESLNTSIKGVEDLAEVTAVPLLATVVADGKATPLVGDDPLGARREAFRQLRTNLQFAALDRESKVIAVTSALPGEGKSTVSSSLAVALAEVGMNVCLVDGDLRQPVVAERFGLLSEVGLSTVLVGRVSLEGALQSTPHRITVLASGTVPPNPTEMISSPRFRALLRDLGERFDMIIIDTPPTLPTADAAVLAAVSDGVLLVVAAGETTRTDVQQAVGNLERVNAPLLGTVLNKVAPTGRNSGRYNYQPRPARPEAAPEPTRVVPAMAYAPSGEGEPNGYRRDGGVAGDYRDHDTRPSGPAGR